MLEVMKFIFSGFWVFVGTMILLTIVCQTIYGICVAFAVKRATQRRRGEG